MKAEREILEEAHYHEISIVVAPTQSTDLFLWLRKSGAKRLRLYCAEGRVSGMMPTSLLKAVRHIWPVQKYWEH